MKTFIKVVMYLLAAPFFLVLFVVFPPIILLTIMDKTDWLDDVDLDLLKAAMIGGELLWIAFVVWMLW